MRHLANSNLPARSKNLGDWATIKTLFPYVLKYPWRVGFALSCLVLAKVSNLGIPIVLKYLIDDLALSADDPKRLLIVPIALIFGYGALRLASSLFTELREFLFSKVTQHAVRKIAIEVFEHLHSLSLRFHLARQTGGVSRDIDRGSRGIQSLISYSLYSIVPTIIEFSLVLIYLGWNYDWMYAAITFTALVCYIIYTVKVTEWRTQYRRKMNEMDTSANQKAIDSLLNFEPVKYFGNEKFEASRYDTFLASYQEAAIQSQRSLAVLNIGQQIIIVIGLIAILWRAILGVEAGLLTLGDLVLINTLMIQLYIPLNFLGVIYREIKQALLDMDNMFSLLGKDREIQDKPSAQALQLVEPKLGPKVVFDQVNFFYDPNRPILKNVQFEILPGTTTAVVGRSGSGKSTLARLLFRFYDVQSGSILIDDQPIKEIQQASLRKAIGIVPQDTVLFNDSIGYNIAYGNPTAEKAIQAEINKLTSNRTALIIAHRLSTIVHAEQILVMSAGEIVERGTHEQLIALQGQYAQMWSMQQQESEPLLAEVTSTGA